MSYYETYNILIKFYSNDNFILTFYLTVLKFTREHNPVNVNTVVSNFSSWTAVATNAMHHSVTKIKKLL